MDSLSDSTKIPFILNMHEGTLLDPHYYRNNGTASLRDNNFHKIKDPQWQKRTTCQYQGLQSFVNNFGILVRRSLVHSAMEDWIVPVLLYNSDPCSNSHDDCHCHPVTIHAQIIITRVEYVQDTWDIQATYKVLHRFKTVRPHLLPHYHLISKTWWIMRCRCLPRNIYRLLMTLLSSYMELFPVPGTPTLVVHWGYNAY